MKTLSVVLAVSALALSSTCASAWFKICNAKSNGADMLVTYAYYEPSITTIYVDACGSFTRVFSPQYYTAWKNTGWWHITKNQCATVYTPAINNRWAYVYAQISDGSTLVGANQPNQVSNVPLGIDHYIGGPFGSCSGECIGQTGSGDCANPAPTYWNVNALPVDQGNYQNFTVTIH
jgi:hypothetical protein